MSFAEVALVITALGGLITTITALRKATAADWQTVTKAQAAALADLQEELDKLRSDLVHEREARKAAQAAVDELRRRDWERELEVRGERAARIEAEARVRRLQKRVELLESIARAAGLELPGDGDDNA